MWYFVLPGKTYSNGRYLAGAVVDLLEAQAEGWIGESLSKGYKTEAGAKQAATNADAPQSVGELAEPKDAKKASVKDVEEKVSDGS